MVACSPSLVQPPSCCAHDPLLAPRPRQAAAGRNLCRWNSEGQGSQGTLLNRSCCLLAGTKRAESPETILSQRWQQERQDRLHDSPQTNCKDWVPARLGRVAPHSLSVHRTTSMDDARPLLQLLLRCFLGAPVHTRPWDEVHVLILQLSALWAPGLSQPGSKWSLGLHAPPLFAASTYSRPCNSRSPKDGMFP